MQINKANLVIRSISGAVAIVVLFGLHALGHAIGAAYGEPRYTGLIGHGLEVILGMLAVLAVGLFSVILYAASWCLVLAVGSYARKLYRSRHMRRVR